MEFTTSTAFAAEMRCQIIKMLTASGSGHPGGSLSATDIIAHLYHTEMHVDPAEPQMADRDRFVLCKGHAVPALYAALALRGFFPADDLLDLRKYGSKLQGHPDMKKVPGVDMSTGSLGQGLSAACGMALAGKLNASERYVYAVCGDGEMEEGQVWEAAMFAAHYKLDKLIAFLDMNGLQIDGPTEQVMNVAPLDAKWEAFGWHVQVIDGHDHAAIAAAIAAAKAVEGQPSMIICKTVKGKGVSFMENQVGWHGVAPKPEQAEQALAEIAKEASK